MLSYSYLSWRQERALLMALLEIAQFLWLASAASSPPHWAVAYLHSPAPVAGLLAKLVKQLRLYIYIHASHKHNKLHYCTPAKCLAVHGVKWLIVGEGGVGGYNYICRYIYRHIDHQGVRYVSCVITTLWCHNIIGLGLGVRRYKREGGRGLNPP